MTDFLTAMALGYLLTGVLVTALPFTDGAWREKFREHTDGVPALVMLAMLVPVVMTWPRLVLWPVTNFISAQILGARRHEEEDDD